MTVTILLGLQWGDEGKGKMVDILSQNHRHIVRSHGGANAGHTLVISGQEYKFHLIPSGIIYPHTQCYLAAGVVIDPEVLFQEFSTLEKEEISFENRLFISKRAHIVMPYHKLLDKWQEQKKGKSFIGTTGKGIGPCYTDKTSRIGFSVGDLFCEDIFFEKLKTRWEELDTEIQDNMPFDELVLICQLWKSKLKSFVVDVEHKLSQACFNKEKILLEGAHGTMLDISYGTYPFVTSSGCIAASVLAGCGLGPLSVKRVCGVVKAYTTRVGSGPMPTEFRHEEQGLFLSHERAREIGTTTGRLRRMGWLDIPLLKRSIELSGVSDLVLTKLDILDSLDEIKICTHYHNNGKKIDIFPLDTNLIQELEPQYITLPGWKQDTTNITNFSDLPQNAKQYILEIQSLLKTPISNVFVGPSREQTISCQ